MNLKNMPIAIDFDGTCVSYEYPSVGKDIGAQAILKRIVENGGKLILWTMRSGKQLDDAIEWFRANEIPLFGIQANPTQFTWTKSNKCYAKLYIDDAALGAPLKSNSEISNRAFIDWERVAEMLGV
jgi:hypothetical protein